jgi:GT2 family glycosyltransferase
MDLSLIIVSWNTRELTRQCLESIFSPPTAIELEVFVVDNASTDGSSQMVRGNFPHVHLLENAQNAGFAAANNQAISLSTGRYVLLLNSDAVVKPGALDRLVEFMDTHPQAGAAGARLLNPDGSQQYSCSPAPTLEREVRRMFHLPGVRSDGYYEMKNWDNQTPVKVDVLLGACLLLRRQALAQVGLMDEGYFMYSEEVDLCHRIQVAGWQLYWVPQATVVHYGGQSTRQASEEMFLKLYESKLRYFRKHYGGTTVVMYKLILTGASLIRLLLFPLAWLERPPRREAHLALAVNYQRLLVNLPGM